MEASGAAAPPYVVLRKPVEPLVLAPANAEEHDLLEQIEGLMCERADPAIAACDRTGYTSGKVDWSCQRLLLSLRLDRAGHQTL